MDKEIIEVKIKGIAMGGEKNSPFIILQGVQKGEFLTLPIGPFEASAIIVEMEDVRPPRPLTHDLFTQFFLQHGFSLKHFEIYGFVNDRFFSRIVYKKNFNTFKMELRPGDGIALAVRLGAPLCIDSSIMSRMSSDAFFFQNAAEDESMRFLYLDEEEKIEYGAG